MATPLSFTVAIGRAARRGILVKGGQALESLATPGRLYLDKTGTLTEGRLALEKWDGGDDVRQMVLALERGSRHPVAAAFAEAWPDVEAEHADVHEVLGSGVEGVVNGHHVMVGKPDWVLARASGSAGDADGLTPVLVAVDGVVVARAAFGDRIRPDARAAVRELHERGWDVRLLSGDAPSVVARVARELGIDPTRTEGGATTTPSTATSTGVRPSASPAHPLARASTQSGLPTMT